MRSRKASRQIKRNIKGLLPAEKRESTGSGLNTLLHISAALVAILLPLSLVALAAGIVFRLPDLMAFEIEQSGVLKELALETTGEAVAEEITNFITHKSDALELTTVIARKDVPVFSFMDEVNLTKIRDLLDRVLYPSAFAFALSIILFIVTRLADRRRYLKYALRTSIVIYICCAAFTMALALFRPLRDAVFAWQPGLEFKTTDVLPQFYGGLYPLLSAGMACLISFIIYIALYGLMMRFTKEKETMFK